MKWVQIVVLSLMVMISGCATNTGGANNSDLAEAEANYIEIGFRHLEYERSLEARKAFNRALEIDDNSWESFLGLAMVHQLEAEPEEAERYFKLSIRKGGESEARYHYARFLWISQNRLDEAYEQIIKVTDDLEYVGRAKAFEDRAVLDLYLRQYEKAKEHFKKAVILNKMLPMPYWHLSNLYYVDGDFEQSYYFYRRFEELVAVDLAVHSEETLLLGMKVTEALAFEAAYSSLLGQLKDRFPESKAIPVEND